MDTKFSSSIAPVLNDFLAQKRSLGYKYSTEENVLRTLDRYWHDNNGNNTDITEKSLEGWMQKKETETVASRSNRVSVLRQFTLYLNSIGKQAFVPMDKYIKSHSVFHVLNTTEIQELFQVIDTYEHRCRQSPEVTRMIQEYKILFRLILTTGLRKSEALCLRLQDVNLSENTVSIYQGKRRKDRLVYMSPDMSDLISEYLKYLSQQIGSESFWLFPSVDPAKHMSGGCAQRFRDFWNMTPSALKCEKAPTIHSLRHTYVVLRMNQWMENGYDLKVMMPYLSRQLGHVSAEETFYYYHQVIDAHRIIHQKDTLASLVLPEVRVK